MPISREFLAPLAARLRRREFLRLAGLTGATALAAACGSPSSPAAQPTQAAPATAAAPKVSQPVPATSPAARAPQAAPAASPAAKAGESWDQLAAGAKSEGQVVITTLAGDGYRKILDTFQAAYPGVAVEHKPVSSASFLAPQVLQEQQGGVYSYDVALLSPGGPVMGTMMPAGAFDDLRPILTVPDVADDSKWIGNVDARYMDNARRKVHSMTWDKSMFLYRNTDLVKDGEIKSVRDLLDPKWKGKMMFMEYTTGFTYSLVTAMNYHMKDQTADVVKGIFKDQEPVYVRETRQATEALIRGQVAFATGPSGALLAPFLAQGLGKNVQTMDVPELRSINLYGVLLYTRAPHPNAAKLLANWLLSKDGGTAMSENLRFNSRRSDVPPIDPSGYPGANYEEVKKSYLFANIEESVPLQQKAIAQLKSLLVT